MKTKAYLSMLYYDVLAWFFKVDKWSNLRKQSRAVYLEVVRLTKDDNPESNRVFWSIMFALIILIMFFLMEIFVRFYPEMVFYFYEIFVKFYLQVM
jgi:hypothetical protein